MTIHEIKRTVSNYFTNKILEHGPTHWGVDWNSTESQRLRFSQLLKIVTNDVEVDKTEILINDFGCGYGALYDYTVETGNNFFYVGLDVSKEMISCAQQLHVDNPRVRFTLDEYELPLAEYTIASGIFNIKFKFNDTDWLAYVLKCIETMALKSAKGFSFNCLTTYSDPEYMRDDLYYADPCFFFDYCKKQFSRNVALLHDYELYEFTILVRKTW